MKCISVNIIILAVLFCMQSCIKEDTSDCKDSALRLRFRYTLNNRFADLFSSDVHKVTAYIFDTDGKYLESYSETGSRLAGNYIMTIPLPEGEYQAVVFCDNLNTFSVGWADSRTNSFNEGLQPGVTSITDFRVMLNSVEGPDGYLVPQSLPGELYAGYIADAPSTYDTSYATDVYLMKDTKNVIVKVYGIDLLTRSVAAPEIYITAVNGRYKNDNSIDTSHRMIKYTPHNTSVTGNMLESDLKTMRLMTGYKPVLVVKHPSVPGYILNRDITELILSNPKYVSQEDIDREDTFLFEINISRTDNNIIISLSINGWDINTVVPVTD